ncbi:MAG: UTP--glucose-1-phosphate uridylyltransferase [Marivita sp.]|uniref:UTP--glucose-1-phosphate uridylyltransferase n=1 Tax=Marivita sp. TaxID=2003365 RepID=UPI0025B8A9CB|nr:UTP--glucose-1-phosphate uridylyltransferase [Marivita sp.]MCI5110634.1 UTP--glucose-1-phosphate uridylyltransferase [Marivita sp.]
MTRHVRTAIFPVAGLGTRFLPATKATPKELLPVLDTPLIQYAVDEAREAGIERLVFVSHPSKSAIERHVMEDMRLTKELRARGKADVADALSEAALSPVEDDARFVMQTEPKGLGHAVLCAKDHVLDGPVAVILPDDLILGQVACLTEMVEAYADGSVGHLVATMEVPEDKVHRYGILSVTGKAGSIVMADGMVEKPKAKDAPSRQAVVGRYILDPSIFSALETQPPGAGGEIQLTDAIARGAADLGLGGFQFSGTRFDCGSKAGMFEATLELASRDPECLAVLKAHGLVRPGPAVAA